MSLFLTYPVYGTFISIVLIYLILKLLDWVDTRPRLSASLLALPYFLFSLPRIISSPPVVDELRFVKFAEDYGLHDHSLIQMLYAPNLEGFGGLWWSLESLSFRFWNSLTPDSSTFLTIASLRFLSIFCVTIWLSTLFILAGKGVGEQRFIALLAALTPMVWWSGKLASPELISASFLGIGVFLLIKSRFMMSSILLGLAVGFKISAIAPVIAISVYLIFRRNKDFDSFRFYSKVRFLTVLFGSFLACNAYIVSDPSSFFRLSRRVNPIISSQLPSNNIQETMVRIFTQDEMHWDFVSKNGLTYWVGGLLTFLCLFILLATTDQKSFKYISLLSLLIVILSLLFADGLDFPWYYFPTIFLIFTLLASKPLGFKSPMPRFSNLPKIALILAIVSSLTNARQENSQVLNYIQDSRQFGFQKACIENNISLLRSDMQVYSMIFPAEEVALGGIAENTWEASVWLNSPTSAKVLLAVGARGEAALHRVKNVDFRFVARCGHYSFFIGKRSPA